MTEAPHASVNGSTAHRSFLAAKGLWWQQGNRRWPKCCWKLLLANGISCFWDFVYFAACSQFAWTGRTYPISGRTAGTASAGDSTPTPKGKPAAAKKAAAKSKALPKPGKAGVMELSRTKLSDLKESLPKYNRAETKKGIQNEIMTKAR